MFRESEMKLKEIEKFKDEEFHKLKYFFSELHRLLETREEQIKRQYVEIIKETQSFLQ